MLAVCRPRTTRSQWFLVPLLLAGLLFMGTGVFSAAAQPSDAVETEADARSTATVPAASAERKSPGRAVFYSAAGTAVLAPVCGVGLVVGPAFGHFYAGNQQRARRGITLRTVSLGGAALGGILALGKPRLGWTLLTLGILVTGGSAVYDTAMAWDAATDYNASHGLRAGVTPTVGPSGEHVGLALRVTF